MCWRQRQVDENEAEALRYMREEEKLALISTRRFSSSGVYLPSQHQPQ
jgi:hypothetical protein